VRERRGEERGGGEERDRARKGNGDYQATGRGERESRKFRDRSRGRINGKNVGL